MNTPFAECVSPIKIILSPQKDPQLDLEHRKHADSRICAENIYQNPRYTNATMPLPPYPPEEADPVEPRIFRLLGIQTPPFFTRLIWQVHYTIEILEAALGPAETSYMQGIFHPKQYKNAQDKRSQDRSAMRLPQAVIGNN